MDDNLRRHDPRYPTAERLRSVTWEGRSGAWGTPSFGATARPLDDDPAGPRSVFRWRPEVQEEFAERADWMLP